MKLICALLVLVGMQASKPLTITVCSDGSQITNPENLPAETVCASFGKLVIENTPTPTPEPEDVPAIQGWTRATCTDKTRILMHDEQEPPKYWCHRVNP